MLRGDGLPAFRMLMLYSGRILRQATMVSFNIAVMVDPDGQSQLGYFERYLRVCVLVRDSAAGSHFLTCLRQSLSVVPYCVHQAIWPLCVQWFSGFTSHLPREVHCNYRHGNCAQLSPGILVDFLLL